METGKSNFSAGLQRLVAFIIDKVVIILFYFVSFLLLKGVFYPMFVCGTGIYFALTMVILVIPSLYFILMWRFFGASVGMFALKLRIVEYKTGHKPSLLTSLKRIVVFYLSFFSFLVGYLWLLWDSRRQNWADKLSGTLILCLNESPSEASQKDIKAWQTGKILFYITILIFIILNVFWQYEQQLLPEAEMAIRDYSPEDNPRANGFYELYSFSSADSIDTFEAGFEEVTRVNDANIEFYKSFGFLGPKYKVETGSLKQPDMIEGLEILQELFMAENVIAAIRTNSEMIQQNMQRYDYLEERYNRIPNYEYINNPVFQDFFVNITSFMPLILFHRLYCADIVLKYVNGDRQNAVARLEKNMAVSRVIVQQADNMLLKLVGNVLYRVSLSTCEELINYEETIDPLLTESVLNYSPLSAKEISFRKAFMGEYDLAVAPYVRNLHSPRGFLDLKVDREDVQKANPLLVKANQMLNYRIQRFENLSELSELPVQDFYRKFGTIENVPIHWINYINNPIGLIMSLTSDNQGYLNHLPLPHDNQIHQNMLKAAAAIKANKISEKDIPGFLEENKANWGNFYTGEALNWDAATKELSFTGPLQEQKADERILKLKL
ncbi:MAG: RDD family protein [Candidatus Cloacimonetes bacterium]|nr:RDD family protein [Candidatus Cloacimonadota bacterium]